MLLKCEVNFKTASNANSLLLAAKEATEINLNKESGSDFSRLLVTLGF